MPSKQNTLDETVSIRLPPGTANKIRAATGQPVSRLCRVMLMHYLEALQRQGRLREGGAIQTLHTDAAAIASKEADHG